MSPIGWRTLLIEAYSRGVLKGLEEAREIVRDPDKKLPDTEVIANEAINQLLNETIERIKNADQKQSENSN